MLDIERQYWGQGLTSLAGVDEAGRGPLAGPVVAAAVIFSSQYAEAAACGELNGLTDSKKLSEKRRELFYGILQSCSDACIGVGISSVEEIDEINILNATYRAMAAAVGDLSKDPEYVIVDGSGLPELSCPATAIVKGDSKSLTIAAASIIAKVVRDRMMMDLDRLYPQYGFCRHKGYGTAVHMQALNEHGPSPHHRMSFRPVREAAEVHGYCEQTQMGI